MSEISEKELTYADNGVQAVEREELGKIVDILQRSVVEKNNSLNEGFPPGYYDYIPYEHRNEAYNLIGTSDDSISGIDNLFRIGDCFFIIPPEYINVTVENGHDNIQGIRQSGSVQIKHGFSNKNINVSLVLNGLNQINGYEVNSPFNYFYHVDGLRTLLSQFKYTPFLPIENPLINLVHGINAVALRSINVMTLEGFPEALRVDIVMQEFNTKAYLGEDETIFGDMIDWDLFRYYIQQPLRKGHKNYLSKITTPKLTNEFKFKILKADVLSGYKVDKSGNIITDKNGNPIAIGSDDESLLENAIDITNDGYYTEMVTDKDNLHLVNMVFGMSNIMTTIQLSAHESPTHQYFGTTDTEFNFTFQTTDESVVSNFNEMNSQNQSLIRDNREVSGIGFMKIDNELVKLVGVNFLLISSVDVSTVPGFPELYNITVGCISYDSNQKETEKLIALNPFPNNRKGTSNDLIYQEIPGVSNKIRQDAEIEKKIMELELYPDLCLPTYEEIDEVISNIRAFRTKNNLIDQMAISSMPRHLCEMPGSLEDSEYSKYVDPDFYIMYLSKLSDMKTSNKATDIAAATSNNLSYSKTKIEDLMKNGVSTYGESNVSEILKQSGGNLLDIFPFTKPKPDSAIEPEYLYGYENENIKYNNSTTLKDDEDEPSFGGGSSSGGGSGGSGQVGNPAVDPTSVKKKYGNPFVDLCCDRADAGCGYVWAASGQIYSPAVREQFYSFGPSNYVGTERWYGKQVFDCSGFISWAMRKIGLKPEGWRIVSGQFGNYGTRVSSNELQVGDVFYDGTHCGIVLDDNKTVEAMGTQYGVCYSKVNKSRYNFVRLTGVKEANVAFLKNNKGFYKSNAPIYNDGGNIVGPYSITDDKKIQSFNKSTTQEKLTRATSGQITYESDGGGKIKPPVLGNFGGNDACDKWNSQITKVANTYGFDPNFIKTIMKIESGGNPNAVSSYDSPNIVGLMQIYLKYHKSRFKGTNYFDPEDNINASCSIFKDYSSPSWVNYNLERTICCYNAGPGTAQDVYLNKTKSLPTETFNYIEKYKKYYSQLIANGGYSGITKTLTYAGRPINSSGGVSNDGNSSQDTPNSSNDTTISSGYEDAVTNIATPNANSGKVHNDSVGTIDFTCFGKASSLFISKANAKSDKYFSFQGTDLGKKLKKLDTKMSAEWMFHDAVQYSHKGRLTRAFPSFLFIIADEQSDWIDGKKLWTNYYVYRSVLDINIHQAYDNPISTAKVTLTNFHNNLSKIISKPSTKDLLENGLVKFIYNLTGAIIDEKITDEMINLKNQLKREIYLYEGSRIHIRLGYGSNPAKYPTSFNGTITNIEHGELITLIAQSDGVELISNPLTDKTNQTNKDLDLSEETSNMIAQLLCSRESEFLYNLTSGNAKINNRNGIEHFGIYFDAINGIDMPGILDGEIFERETWDSENWDGVQVDFGILSGRDQYQYDLVQNIYKGRYDAIPFSALSFLGFDGEANCRFFASGKNSWDIMKMCEKSMPDFVAYPRYFGFESRLFYGVPSWLCGYKYEVLDSNGDLYRKAKSFAQVHNASSMDSIIDNTIAIDTRNLYTNFVGIYTLGGDLATTPAIMSDHKIDWSRQKTKTIDTTSVQDFAWIPGIADKFLSWSGLVDNGKMLAIRVCVSELAISWKETYVGNLLILGQPEVQAHDWVYLDDSAIKMAGMVIVREVVHSMSVSTGFTTSIVPGMMTFNTLKQSGLSNNYRTAMFVTVGVATWVFSKWISIKSLALISKVYNSCKMAVYVGSKFRTVASFTATKGKDIYGAIKTGKAVTNTVDFVRKADKLCDVARGSKKLYTIGKTTAKALMTTSLFTPHGLAALVAWLAIDFILGWLITFFIDMFAYRNCIIINPLMIASKDGTVKAYAGNIKGGSKILPMISSAEEYDES